MSRHAKELRKRIRGEVEDSEEVLAKASRDASVFSVVPEAVVFPKDAEDVEKIVRYVAEQKASGDHISLTARAAGTDMSGGPLNDSIIMDVTRHLNTVGEINNGYAIAEPGVFYRDFDKATQEKGWELPSYTASREICTVGGMTANDSGGEKNLKFGKTSRYVKELEMVLADGKRYTFSKLAGEALEAKLHARSFEGDLYRGVADIIRKHRAVIEHARPKVSKNSSGYAIWDIGDPDKGELDLARLMVGSQGTLGMVTRIRFSLIQPKKYAAMAVIMLRTFDGLGDIVDDVLEYDPDSFESYDDNTFKLAVKYFPEMARQMKTGIFSLGMSFLPEVRMILTGGIPKLVLLAEFRGNDQEEVLARARRAAKAVGKKYKNARTRVARNEREIKKYWTVRRESFNLLRSKVRGMRTAPFIDDFVVPPRVLPEFFPKLEKILSHYNLTYTVAGHVGDGNFHIIPLMDPNRPDAAKVIGKLSGEVYDLVLSYDGSITGEHNDGLIRTPYVEQMFGEEMQEVFEDIKKLFDPLNIFNPGKKVGMTFDEAMTHLDFAQKSAEPHP